MELHDLNLGIAYFGFTWEFFLDIFSMYQNGKSTPYESDQYQDWLSD